MKAFYEMFPDAKDNRGNQVTQAQKKGFRAALQWALTHREMGHTVNRRYIIPAKVIEQELSDE